MYLIKPIPYVKKLLTENPHLRDDDNKLISNFWHKEVINLDIDLKEESGLKILELFAEGKLTSPESIGRVRRKLQEEFTYLRGNKWEERQGRLQKKVIKQLTETPELLAGGLP
mgnify:CR=1 FL=1|tara:strand:- start:243 stop:581 length:339 start_codon:yes stop_codon:yes gene_type:complete